MVDFEIKFGQKYTNVFGAVGQDIEFILTDGSGNTIDGSNILVVDLIEENINNSTQVLITLNTSHIDANTFISAYGEYTDPSGNSSSNNSSFGTTIPLIGSKSDISTNIIDNSINLFLPFDKTYSNIKTVYIPYVVNSIEKYTFMDFTNLENIYVDNIINSNDTSLTNLRYSNLIYPLDNIPDVTGVLFGLEGTIDINNIDPSYVLLKYGEGIQDPSYNIPYDPSETFAVTKLGESAFEKNKYLQEITIANTVEKISKYCFAKCENLSSVIFEPSSNLTTLEKASFEECHKITSIQLPDKLKSIGEDAFAGCGFETITIVDSVEKIDRNAFGPAKSEDFISLDDQQQSVIESSLNTVYLNPDTLAALNNYISLDNSGSWPTGTSGVFGDNQEPSKIPPNSDSSGVPIELKFGSGNTFFGQSNVTINQIVDYTKNLLKITDINDKVKYLVVPSNTITAQLINDSAVARHDIKTVEYIKTDTQDVTEVTILGEDVFKGCTSLENVALPTTLTSINKSAFEGCTSLENVTLPTILTIIGTSAFEECTSLKNVTLPTNVTDLTINNDVFKGCYLLTSIDLPSKVTTLKTGSLDRTIEIETSGNLLIKLLNDDTLFNMNMNNVKGSVEPNENKGFKVDLNTVDSFISYYGISMETVENIALNINPIQNVEDKYITTIDSLLEGQSSSINTLKIENPTSELNIIKSLAIKTIELNEVTISSSNALDNMLSEQTKSFSIGNDVKVTDNTDNTDNTEKTVSVVEMENKDQDTSKVYGVLLNDVELFKLLHTDTIKSIQLPSDINRLREKSFQYANVEKLYISDDKEVYIKYGAFDTLQNGTNTTYIFNPILDEIHLTIKSLDYINDKLEISPSYTFNPSKKQEIYIALKNNVEFGASSESEKTLTLINSNVPNTYGTYAANSLTLKLKFELDNSTNDIIDITLHIPIDTTETRYIINKDTYTTFDKLGFKEGDITETNITEVYIPYFNINENQNNICIIGLEAFEDCKNMKNLEFKLNINENNSNENNNLIPINIETRAFKNCNQLKIVKFPSNLENINAYAFEKCTGLKTIILRNSISYMHENAFSNIRNNVSNTDNITIYTNDVINKNLNKGSDTNINFYKPFTSFYGIQYPYINIICLLNRNDLLESSGTTLTRNIVEKYTFLAPHVIVEEFESIEASVFNGSCLLNKIELSKTCTSLNDNVFSNCYSLEEVTLSKDIKTFPDEVFYNCENLKKIIQDNVNNIEYDPSLNTYSGTDGSVDTKKDVSGNYYIGERAFSKSSTLDFTNIEINDIITIKDEAFEFCNALNHIELPVTLKKIGKDAFKNTNLSSIYIPRQVSDIGNNAFKNTDLETVYLGGINKDLLSKTKNNFPYGKVNDFFGLSPTEITIKLLYDSKYNTNYDVSTNNMLKEHIAEDLKQLNDMVPLPSDVDKYSIDLDIVNVKIIANNLLDSSTIYKNNNITISSGFPNITLGTIDIPDVTHIGKRSFYSNYTMKLKDNKLPQNLVEVGAEAFENCKLLEVENICDLRGKVGKTEGYQAFKDTPVANTVCTQEKTKTSAPNVLKRSIQLMQSDRNTVMPLNNITKRSTKLMKFT